MARYQQAALSRVNLEVSYNNALVRGRSDPLREWTVQDGSGKTLDAIDFARTIGDQERVDALEAERTSAKQRALWLTLSGVALVGASVVPTLLMSDLAAQEFGSDPWYAAMVGNDLKIVATAGLAAVGSGCLVTGLVQIPLVNRRQERIQEYYSLADADRRIETYNAAMRLQSGMTGAAAGRR